MFQRNEQKNSRQVVYQYLAIKYYSQLPKNGLCGFVWIVWSLKFTSHTPDDKNVGTNHKKLPKYNIGADVIQLKKIC